MADAKLATPGAGIESGNTLRRIRFGIDASAPDCRGWISATVAVVGSAESAARGMIVFPLRYICQFARSCPGSIPEVKSDNPPAMIVICAFVRSTLLFGSITAMSATIAATSCIPLTVEVVYQGVADTFP